MKTSHTQSTHLVLESLLDFLESSPPFQELEPEQIKRIIAKSQEISYAAGTQIYAKDQSPIDHLSIVRSGKVEKYLISYDGHKEFPELYGPGDYFGEIAMLSHNPRSLHETWAIEKTSMWQIPGELFGELLRENTSFHDFFYQRFARRLLNERFAALLERENVVQSPPLDLAEIYFRKKVEDLYYRHVYCLSQEKSIQEAAQAMRDRQTGYLLSKDHNGKIKGIVTDFDLRTKVVAAGLDLQMPVKTIHSHPLITVSYDAHIYEALLLMFKHKVKYLVVRKNHQNVGILKRNQLLHHQSKSPFLFIQSIQNARGLDALKSQWDRIPPMVDQLFQRGVRAETVNELISTTVDTISQNIVKSTLEQLRKPPIPFVFIALGSEGRREQTLKTDQDNAIIYSEEVPGSERYIKDYLDELGSRISDALNEVGFDYCPGNYMAKNPHWVQPLSVWREYYQQWIKEGSGESFLNTSIFFDARAIYGDTSLLLQLQDAIEEILDPDNTRFYSFWAKAVLSNKPPLNLFQGFQLTKTEEKKQVLDIKKAMQIGVDFARMYALKHRIRATNTGQRLAALARKKVMGPADYTEFKQAYYYMMQLRLKHQIKQISELKTSPDNLLEPNSLTKVERVTLREVFRILRKFQTRMSIDFTGSLGN